jgi:hypothetical protein
MVILGDQLKLLKKMLMVKLFNVPVIVLFILKVEPKEMVISFILPVQLQVSLLVPEIMAII